MSYTLVCPTCSLVVPPPDSELSAMCWQCADAGDITMLVRQDTGLLP